MYGPTVDAIVLKFTDALLFERHAHPYYRYPLSVSSRNDLMPN